MADGPRDVSEGRRIDQDASPGTDEVSLREVYLTFRAGLPLIALVAVLAGSVAFGFVLSKPRVYQASAVVHVLPTTVTPAAASTVALNPPVGVDLETYRSAAQSDEVLDAAGAAAGIARADFAARLELTATPAAQLSRGQQVVRHSATMRSPAEAAAVVNAWAEATVASLRRVMSQPLDVAIAAAEEEMLRRQVMFDAASAAWSEFLSRDERPALRARIAAEGAGDTARLRAQLASLESEASAAQRDLAAAQLAYYRSAPLPLQLELQRDLVVQSASVAVRANVPVEPRGRNLVVTTLASAVVAGLLATLFVFLRRAVSPA